MQLKELLKHLEQRIPLHLAEEWDNVGLLIGNREKTIQRVMTCLTVTPDSVAEAIAKEAELVITHHPFPFRSVKSITTDDTVGQMILQLIQHRVSVYSPHTAFDSAAEGINQQLAIAMAIRDPQPIIPTEDASNGVPVGTGRFGELATATSLEEVAEGLKSFLQIPNCRYVGPLDRSITRPAIACGSAGQFLADAARHGCDLLVTGESSFHTCLEAEARGIGMILLGHFASERFAVEALATDLADQFAKLSVWASEQESDPLGLI